jgi:hypothetical protein
VNPTITNFAFSATLLSSGLFAMLLLLLEVGRRVGRRRVAADKEGGRAGLGAVEGAVFGLFGLLVAFTFAGAGERFEGRRLLIESEANALGTYWLRLDMLPPETRPAIRDLCRSYIDTRLEAYRVMPDLETALHKIGESKAIAARLWSESAEACRTEAGRAAAMLVLPALNESLDIASKRVASANRHPPIVIFVMLAALALGAALLAGHAMAAAK